MSDYLSSKGDSSNLIKYPWGWEHTGHFAGATRPS